jgi:hypothetical protein
MIPTTACYCGGVWSRMCKTGRKELVTWLSDPVAWKSYWLVEVVSERIARKLLSTQTRKDAIDVATMYRAALQESTKAAVGLQRGFDLGTASRMSLDLPNRIG